ncbi:amylo-alpha-1,6-glucosidase [Paenibacillus humicus]|uniref:amylo-alpha-1,6-glucosidase n=1 Tax=Paenibacillus humicus TaxID=412861 RepID=UPI003F1904C7
MDYRVIKENDLFLMTDHSGDIPERQEEGQGFGLYTRDTRFLSVLELRINGKKPIVLSSEADENYLSTILLTNPHMEMDGKLELWRESIEIKRTRFIYGDVLYETVEATNYSPTAWEFELSLRFAADFTDMFVIRGFQSGGAGVAAPPLPGENGLAFAYDGLDGIKRSLIARWSRQADRFSPEGEAAFRMKLESGQSSAVHFSFAPTFGEEEARLVPRDEALEALRRSYREWNEQATSVDSDLPAFNRLYGRGLQDIRVLLTDIGFGPFPVAGLPWFAVPFGRDSLITALQLLPIQPEAAKGTLLTMAHFQGTKEDPWRDEHPGKIMHELRKGELANTNQVPFNPYYGSVDSTPLFLVLLGEYVRWTGDMNTLKRLLPHADRALEWIDRYGDHGGRGFTSYYQESSKGIANQGWKDSADSVVHRDGRYAEAPVALVEVQGYVYQAKQALAGLFRTLNDPERSGQAVRLEAEAEALRQRFEERFWMEDRQYYAIALDGDSAQVGTVTSNPGHVLMSGLVSPERAEAVARRLISPEMFSGYGIRTMAEGEKAYNPMSYHDGSIWPHDNSLCLMGLARYGLDKEAAVVMEGLLEASGHFENGRLPELFCGYSASRGRAVRYPVACSPQAWAAATPLVFVTAMTGLKFDPSSRTISLKPSLPEGMNRLSVKGMRIGDGRLAVEIVRTGGEYRTTVLELPDGWTVDMVSLAGRQ